MGRKVRMVPKEWQHPSDWDGIGEFIPLCEGPYSKIAAEWDEENAKWSEGLALDFSTHPKRTWKASPETQKYSFEDWSGKRPKPEDYMPEFPEGSATQYVMYEDTSEGTPISPAFDTPEQLARWLADNGASAFGSDTATYDQWLGTINRGFAVSMIMDKDGLRSGVAAMADDESN